MINFKVCPRCSGDVLEYFPADSEMALYINYGWRLRTSPRTYPSRSRLTWRCVTSKTDTSATSLVAGAPRPISEVTRWTPLTLQTGRIDPNRTSYTPAAPPPCVVGVP
jgi:hypothetical protein